VAESSGRYRTKIEVLRDIVRAASTEERKTRIIGMANLNQGSFRRYSALGVSLGLLRTTSNGFSATPAAEEWLSAVDGVLSKGEELATAIEALSRLSQGPANGGNGSGRGRPAYDAVQLLARLAWADVRPGDGLPLGRPAPPPPGPRGRLSLTRRPGSVRR
jgi:predicted transcriptional regulator